MKRRVLIIMCLVVLMAVGVFFILFPGKKSSPAPVVSPSPTASSEVGSQDQQELGQKSKELGAKYFTYTKPNDPAYFATFKPYLTPDFYQLETTQIQRDERANQYSAPLRSTVKQADISDLSGSDATTDVVVATLEPTTGQSYEQTVEIKWQKGDGGWLASSLSIVNTTKGS